MSWGTILVNSLLVLSAVLGVIQLVCVFVDRGREAQRKALHDFDTARRKLIEGIPEDVKHRLQISDHYIGIDPNVTATSIAIQQELQSRNRNTFPYYGGSIKVTGFLEGPIDAATGRYADRADELPTITRLCEASRQRSAD